MSKLRIGIVGCGSWAREAHMPFLQSQADVELAAIVETAAAAHRAELAKRYRPCVLTTTVDDLLDQTVVDGLIISTPHSTHFDIAKVALARGVHVHIDKPICSTLAQTADLIERADEKRLILSTHTQRKYMPGQSQLLWYLRTYFKDLYHIAGSLWQPMFPDYAGSWRADPELAAGGILMDSGYHIIDTILTILGATSCTSIRDIAALAHNANNPNDSFATLVFKVDRTVVQVNAFRGTPKALKKEEYQVLGDGGHASVLYTGTGSRKTCQTLFWSADGARRETEDLPMTSSYMFHPLQLFLEALRGDTDAVTLVRDNLDIARLSLYVLDQAYGLTTLKP